MAMLCAVQEGDDARSRTWDIVGLHRLTTARFSVSITSYCELQGRVPSRVAVYVRQWDHHLFPTTKLYDLVPY